MAQQGESSISVGNIADRAQKLEESQKPVAAAPEAKTNEAPATPAASTEPQRGADGKFLPVEKKDEQKPPVTPEPEKKPLPNDPVELRKWNTKVSMELADVKKQLQAVAEALSRSTKKAVDWKSLAKEPEKLEKAIEAYAQEQVESIRSSHAEQTTKVIADFTRSEMERREHDPAYPGWRDLKAYIQRLAINADPRVNFNQHPKDVMDEMYEVAKEDAAKDPAFKPSPAAPVANPSAKYTEEDLQAKVKEAVEKAVAEAQKGLAAEANGSSATGMGKGAAKGPNTDTVKKAAWSMPMSDLKKAVQEATERLQQ